MSTIQSVSLITVVDGRVWSLGVSAETREYHPVCESDSSS